MDIGSVLRGMADVLEIAICEKCHLAFDVAQDVPTVSLDAALFEQSILNLCLNAAAAMPSGGEILIRYSRTEAGVDGIGMTPDIADKAFEPYFTARDEEGGAGRGLAVVYGFVRQSGGEARILSTLGSGMTKRPCLSVTSSHHGRRGRGFGALPPVPGRQGPGSGQTGSARPSSGNSCS